MQRWRRSVGAALGVCALAASFPATLWAAPCDEYDSASPAGVAEIALDSRDLTDGTGDEMRSFIETGSTGRVDVAEFVATPAGIVAAVSAAPEISSASPYYGETLKGIAVSVKLQPHRRPVRVRIRLRQVCAKHFRDTFLYY